MEDEHRPSRWSRYPRLRDTDELKELKEKYSEVSIPKLSLTEYFGRSITDILLRRDKEPSSHLPALSHHYALLHSSIQPRPQSTLLSVPAELGFLIWESVFQQRVHITFDRRVARLRHVVFTSDCPRQEFQTRNVAPGGKCDWRLVEGMWMERLFWI
ncbi:hypothetical protein K469DRAFT_711209 [Zopfia rhizophila CBS 207.26]|uniref:Uncharacterized protein n=1 Tax=Zopfia rhizophila CBS 207.26 TaxID=1314779 RepID=A0A6A6DZZ2_9PEZI|nr:hypothetical protein K469DRAFT_711209 [Zopfia rhizophila CBS 207.26]